MEKYLNHFRQIFNLFINMKIFINFKKKIKIFFRIITRIKNRFFEILNYRKQIVDYFQIFILRNSIEIEDLFKNNKLIM